MAPEVHVHPVAGEMPKTLGLLDELKAAATVLARPRVLLVEDEPAQRQAMCTALQGAGYDVVEASTGEGALKILYTQPVSAAVLDQNLPGAVQGLEVLHA